MKKILLVFGIMIFLLQPVFGVNWTQMSNKRYIDLDSVQKFNDSYDYNFNKYIFWEKYLNDKSNIFTNAKKLYGKKIWYSLNYIIINCENKTITVKSYTDYDLSGNVLGSNTYQDILLNWDPIAPETIGDDYYNFICKPNN